jgi:hypothetical protein
MLPGCKWKPLSPISGLLVLLPALEAHVKDSLFFLVVANKTSVSFLLSIQSLLEHSLVHKKLYAF